MESLSLAGEHERSIALVGDLDLSVRSALQDRFDDAADAAKIVLVDLREVTYMDSSAIGALISLHRRLKSKGGELRLRLRHNPAYRLLEIAGLIDVFRLEVVQ